MLAVDPDEQGLGAGAMLLEAAETHARDEMGANIAVLWVSKVGFPLALSLLASFKFDISLSLCFFFSFGKRNFLEADCYALQVISVRSELLTWYYSRRYRGTGITQPFPAVPGAIFGQPKEELNFVRLEKDLLP